MKWNNIFIYLLAVVISFTLCYFSNNIVILRGNLSLLWIFCWLLLAISALNSFEIKHGGMVPKNKENTKNPTNVKVEFFYRELSFLEKCTLDVIEQGNVSFIPTFLHLRCNKAFSMEFFSELPNAMVLNMFEKAKSTIVLTQTTELEDEWKI